MDAMALLCNLHADGPTTLRSLREGGCATIDELLGLSAEDLAGLLGIAPASARRFLREGLSLRERLGAELLEREEELQVPAAAPPPPTAFDAGRLPTREREVLAHVMQRWQATGSGGNGSWSAPETQAQAPPTPPPPPVEPARQALVPGALRGLDEEVCRLLAAAGVTSVEELAERSLEQLDGSTRLGFTRLRRLQFLARRQQRGSTPAPSAPRSSEAPEDKISLAFPGRPEPVVVLQPTAAPSATPSAAAAVERSAAPADEAPGGPFA